MRQGVVVKTCRNTNWLLLTRRKKRATLELLERASCSVATDKSRELIKKLIERIHSGQYEITIQESLGEKDYVIITVDLLPPKQNGVNSFYIVVSFIYSRAQGLIVKLTSLFFT